jgi:hypothetical protein
VCNFYTFFALTPKQQPTSMRFTEATYYGVNDADSGSEYESESSSEEESSGDDDSSEYETDEGSDSDDEGLLTSVLIGKHVFMALLLTPCEML